MRVLTKLIYGIFSFNPCNPKKGYKDQKIPLLSMKDLFLYTSPPITFTAIDGHIDVLFSSKK